MLSTDLSGTYKIGDTIVVNVDDRSVLVNEEPIDLRPQLFSALLLFMEQRLHHAAVPYDDFSKVINESRRAEGDVISGAGIRGIVRELNSKLQQKLIVSVPKFGYKLAAEVFPQEPGGPVVPPAAVSEFSQIAEKLNSVIDNIPELIGSTIMMALSGRAADNANDLLDDTPLAGPPALPLAPLAPVSLQSKSEVTYEIGDIVLRDWEIVRYLNRGSYSTVCEVHRADRDIMGRSAIKVIHSSVRSAPITEVDSPADRTVNISALIQRELAYMIALKGTSYIVSYEDHETVDLPDGSQDTIIRMELLRPLTEVLQSTVLTADDVIRLGIDICKALELCVELNIVHRDVKPSNIFLTQWGGYKLGDFSASATTGEQLKMGQIGTLMYMAPEIYRGEALSPNIDTYSLGLVMYELLNGKKIPFLCEEGTQRSTQSRQAALSRRFSGEPFPEIPGVSRSLQSVILKACAFDPAERFQSPLEMRKALERL